MSINYADKLLWLFFVIIPLFVFVAVMLLTIILVIVSARKKVSRLTEPGLSQTTAQKCDVCGIIQKPHRLKRCTECGQYFCLFPTWEADREKWDKIIIPLYILLFCGLTAGSILGGILVMPSLVIPYLIFRAFFPDPKNIPPYWKQCGGIRPGSEEKEYLCKNCGGVSPVPLLKEEQSTASSGYEMSEDEARGIYMYEQDELRKSLSEDRHNDDDDDGGSIWDGWLFKH